MHREIIDNKCSDGTPFFFKRTGAYDGDLFEHYVEYAKQTFAALPTIKGYIKFPKNAKAEEKAFRRKCIVKDGSGVCIVLYEMKEKFVYRNKIYYTFSKNKNGVKIAYKVDVVTGKKKQAKYKKAKKNYNAQKSRTRKAAKKHKQAKKKVRKQYQVLQGCYSPDMAYK
jgi:thiol:disulfide interchange protein